MFDFIRKLLGLVPVDVKEIAAEVASDAGRAYIDASLEEALWSLMDYVLLEDSAPKRAALVGAIAAIEKALLRFNA